jgi:hypothetical protein
MAVRMALAALLGQPRADVAERNFPHARAIGINITTAIADELTRFPNISVNPRIPGERVCADV